MWPVLVQITSTTLHNHQHLKSTLLIPNQLTSNHLKDHLPTIYQPFHFRSSDDKSLGAIGIRPSTVPELLGQKQVLQPLPDDIPKSKMVTSSLVPPSDATVGYSVHLAAKLPLPTAMVHGGIQPPMWLLREHGRQAEAAMGISKQKSDETEDFSTTNRAPPLPVTSGFVTPQAAGVQKELRRRCNEVVTSSPLHSSYIAASLSADHLTHTYIMSVTGRVTSLVAMTSYSLNLYRICIKDESNFQCGWGDCSWNSWGTTESSRCCCFYSCHLWIICCHVINCWRHNFVVMPIGCW